MKLGIAFLVLAYGLSQFFRAFLPVLAPDLQADIGAMPDDLATASGVWFLVFAAIQIPIGVALDRVGPKITAVVLFALGAGGGAFVFAAAQSPVHVTIAMGLIGIGCAPVLMASYFIFARTYSPAVFATLAGATIGIGSLGNLAGASPMAWAVTEFGWRETMQGLGFTSLAVAVLMWVTVKNPPMIETAHRGSIFELLKMPQLWPIFAMMLVSYAPAAGLRGLWAGPYISDMYGADVSLIGQVTLVMGLAMIAGSFAYGPLERMFRTRKWVIVGGSMMSAVALTTLALFPAPGVWASAVLLAMIGFGGTAFPLLVAHAKAFFPAHLTGRGVTLVNLFSIGGVGVAQFITAPLHTQGMAMAGGATTAYTLIFAFFLGALMCGLIAYFFATDRTD
ncbi:putative MFS family arabinose efflux permease [Loktanella ponticola]|uniref:Putative MFS family arabinose efflux permease n=1 Tax=Yoonia ponticola TaxID=1524255 RepID=A0A7W9BMW2_9RHOB|nr:MFS transporter [Yoonia ponticola]MBB5722969.1 putative MFS family arabinose efflux permease [Yoonia ponticola]